VSFLETKRQANLPLFIVTFLNLQETICLIASQNKTPLKCVISILLRQIPRTEKCQSRYCRASSDGLHWTVGLWQINLAAHTQSHVQSLSRATRRRRNQLLWSKYSQKGQDLNLLRAQIGMVFQKPTPFPMSIYDNIAFGVRLYENLSKSDMDDRVESALTKAAIWNEVKDKLGSKWIVPLWRTATAPVYCTHSGRQAQSDSA
jgi:hypothetical protein